MKVPEYLDITARDHCRAAAAYVIDRGEQYEPSDAMRAFVDDLVAGLLKGEHLEALAHGELDDILARLR